MIGWTSRNWISFVMGLMLLVVGGVPLLFVYKVIGFTIPSLPALVFKLLAIVGGGLLLIDATKETVHGRKVYMWLSILFGVPILALGLVPLLNQYNVISFEVAVTELISNIIAAGAGIVLIVDAWKS